MAASLIKSIYESNLNRVHEIRGRKEISLALNPEVAGSNPEVVIKIRSCGLRLIFFFIRGTLSIGRLNNNRWASETSEIVVYEFDFDSGGCG